MSTRDDTAIRDVPRTCTCRWRYLLHPARWVRRQAAPGCAWHRRAATAQETR